MPNEKDSTSPTHPEPDTSCPSLEGSTQSTDKAGAPVTEPEIDPTELQGQMNALERRFHEVTCSNKLDLASYDQSFVTAITALKKVRERFDEMGAKLNEIPDTALRARFHEERGGDLDKIAEQINQRVKSSIGEIARLRIEPATVTGAETATVAETGGEAATGPQEEA